MGATSRWSSPLSDTRLSHLCHIRRTGVQVLLNTFPPRPEHPEVIRYRLWSRRYDLPPLPVLAPFAVLPAPADRCRTVSPAIGCR
jgi:hypothetical protein